MAMGEGFGFCADTISARQEPARTRFLDLRRKCQGHIEQCLRCSMAATVQLLFPEPLLVGEEYIHSPSAYLRLRPKIWG